MPTELSTNAGRVPTHEHLLERVWNERGDGNVRHTRTMVSKLRRKLDDAPCNPSYIFTEPRVPRGRRGRQDSRASLICWVHPSGA